MPPEPPRRASPEALLARARRDQRGCLKIFLGAAPGVGKTYAMLVAARAAMAEGRDVVAGVVETHGRAETEALLDGIKVLPRKPIVYVNRILSEFDIDAALARRPQLLLVDEYAHTNIPGSRHPKRWQDVEELLAAGIDVWTTLNVQHLESLNDVVHRIGRIRVRETVPDGVFDEADEIVLVDLPPDELLKRLAEGKVYFRETAARAREQFFKPQNLTALRELALRRAAERVDSDLIERMQAQAIEGPLPAGERILACIGLDPGAPAIVRTAKRLADLMDAPWMAVTVERPGSQVDDKARRRIDKAMRLAEALGAETSTLVGNDISGEILRVARFENATQIVVGRSRGRLLAELFRSSLPYELVRRAEGIAIHFVTGPSDANPQKRNPRSVVPGAATPTALLWSTVGVAAAVAVGRALAALTAVPNLSMLFLLAVLLPAVLFGVWPAIYASVLSLLAYNFFFIEPLYTFTVAEPHELLALFTFLVVAITAATLAGRVREQARLSVQRVRATRRLYEFTRKLSGLATVDKVAEAAASELHASLARQAVVLLDRDGELTLRAAWPPVGDLDTAAMTAARWALSHDEPAGADTATLPTVPWYFLPLRTPRSRVGVVGVAEEAGAAPLDTEARALLDTLAEQTAVALERASLVREIVATRTAVETERVRNTLLASISHDFRTPLSSILGSATSLLEYGDKIGADARKDLLGQVKTEAEALDGMVRNLLAITRIDAGALELRKDWVDLRDVVEHVVSAMRRRGTTQQLTIDFPGELPLVRADPTLAEQALANIVGNAVAHTPDRTMVTISAGTTAAGVVLRVTDDGPGIAADLLPQIFDKFVRAQGAAAGDGGAGLGLAIAKGIMEAHGGFIAAQSPAADGRGTRVVLTFPRQETPP
ncbi:MAG TPA: sensor histidine kinase KdpD [Hyphomicrobiaceae bacterium]|nr:sensor histidine kinase KdpD [Hyphomicrobiaceae bacterium]